jgi:hypothetical protein
MTDESALFIPVLSAERTVEKYRKKLDPSRICGVPAHITVLYPFVPPTEVTPPQLESLDTLFAASSPFGFVLTEVRWFDDRVVYLAPDPAAPFVELTARLVELFPEYPPYGGTYDDVIPHVCVAESDNHKAMQMAARRVAKRLPIAAQAREVWLMAGNETPNSWTVRRSFTLGSK